jgi:hypothetical protein
MLRTPLKTAADRQAGAAEVDSEERRALELNLRVEAIAGGDAKRQ